MFAKRFSNAIGMIGIDFGTRAVKMLQLRRSGPGFSACGAARIDAAPDHDPEQPWMPTREQWAAALASGGFHGRRCVVSLQRNDVQVKAVQLPRMAEHEMRQAATWEAAHRFNLDRDALQVDYMLTGAAAHGSDEREEALLIAAPRQTIVDRLDPLLDVGLRPMAVDVDFASLARFMIRQHRRAADQSEVRALVDLGYSGASILIVRGGEVVFQKEIKTSGRRLNQLVAEYLDLDERSAAELRMARIAEAIGRSVSDEPLDRSTDRAVYEAVRPMLNDLVNEVVLCLRYYGVTFRGRPPVSIILTGGDGSNRSSATCSSRRARSRWSWTSPGIAVSSSGRSKAS